MEREFLGVWIPREIWENEQLGWSEKILLVEITSLGKTNGCFASNEYFGKFLGVHKKHVSRLISNLVNLGLISVELVYKPHSKQIDKRIIHVTTGNENVPTPRQKCSEPRNENVPTPIHKKVEDKSFIINTDNNNTINNTVINKKEKVSTSQLESEFEMLWKHYPRKMGKANALKSFIKARKTQGVSYETIENGLYRYIDYLKAQGTEEQFIAHGSTWFNQQKWQDEYISIVPQKKIKNFADYYQSLVGSDRNESYGDSQIIDYDPVHLPEPNEKFGGF